MHAVMLFFEVMDKEPRLSAIWIASVVVGLAGLLFARAHPILVTVPLFIMLMYGWLLLSEIHHPDIGRYILLEAGYSYVIGTYLAIIFGLITPFFGVMWWLRSRRLKSSKS